VPSRALLACPQGEGIAGPQDSGYPQRLAGFCLGSNADLADWETSAAAHLDRVRKIRVGSDRLKAELERQTAAARKRESQSRKEVAELQRQLRASQARAAASEQHKQDCDAAQVQLRQKDTQIGRLEAKVERRDAWIVQLQEKCQHLEAQAAADRSASAAAQGGTEAPPQVL